MFEFIKKLFGKGKKKTEPVTEGRKIEFVPLKPEEEEEPEVPASRYTEEYAEFNQQQLAAMAQKVASEEESLEEKMMADPFADVAAQDEDVDVPAPEEPVRKKDTEEAVADPAAESAESE